ncbi:hypothetical protein GQ85_15810, partial [Rhodococcus rhodochrous]
MGQALGGQDLPVAAHVRGDGGQVRGRGVEQGVAEVLPRGELHQHVVLGHGLPRLHEAGQVDRIRDTEVLGLRTQRRRERPGAGQRQPRPGVALQQGGQCGDQPVQVLLG